MMINSSASNWVDRGEPPEPTLSRVLSSYLELDPAAQDAALAEYARIVRGMAKADATEVQIAGYLRTLEKQHLAAEHPARHRRGVAIALWHITKAAEVRDRAQRLIAEYAAAVPAAAKVSLSAWLSERLLRGHPGSSGSA
jgi:hypothetical protein